MLYPGNEVCIGLTDTGHFIAAVHPVRTVDSKQQAPSRVKQKIIFAATDFGV